MKKEIKIFPLRLNLELSEQIDSAVFHNKAKSKHEYILAAIMEKMERDNKKKEAI